MSQAVPTLVTILRHFKWNNIALIKNAALKPFQLKGNLEIAQRFRDFGVNVVVDEALLELFDVREEKDKVFKNVIRKVKGKCRSMLNSLHVFL